MSTEENENIVPDNGVAGFGAPRLDPDPVDDSFLDEFDKLDDEALARTEEATSPAPEQTPQLEESPTDDENFLHDGLNNNQTQTNESNNSTPPEDPTAPGDKAPEPEQPVQHSEDIDPEIAAIEPPRNLSESNQSNWKKLQETASRYKKEALEAEQLRQRVTQLEQSPAQTPADYEELRKFRQIFDLKNDPELKTKYETPISEAKESIYSILRKNGASDETIASIEKVGGPDKVSGAWWKQNVLDKLELLDSKKVEQNLLAVADLREKQEKEYADLATRGEEILEAKKNENLNWYNRETESIDKTITDLTKDVPWARYKEIPANAAREEIEKIQKHNATVSDLQQKFQASLWPTDAKSRTEVAAAATFSHVLANQLKVDQAAKAQLEARVKALEQENSQLKMAGRTPKPSANTTANKVTATTNDRWKMSASDAIDMGLDEAGL
jgi:hypothetical protein